MDSMELLLKNSQNIQLLIETVKLHEQTVANFVKPSESDVTMKEKECTFVECNYGSIFNPEPMFCPLSRTMFKPEDKVIRVKECNHIFSRELFFYWI